MVRLFMIVPAAMCLLALLHLPYGYYQLLRLVVTICGAFLSFAGWKMHAPVAAAVFGIVALAYNPVLPLALGRSNWEWANAATAIIFLGALGVWSWLDRSSTAGARA